MLEYLSSIDGNAIYIIAVIMVTLAVLFWGLKKIRKEENLRLKSAKHMDVSSAVETDSPDEDIESITRRRAMESLEARFEFIRRAFVPLVLGIAALLIIIPLLPTLPATYVSLITGLLAVLVGLAGKPVIENAISGIVITFSQPIRINDTVIIDGMYGDIERITLLYTVLRTWNWRRYIIPNHKLLQKEFENLSQTDEYEWAYIEFFVAPGTNLSAVKEIAKNAMQSKYLFNTEPPSFWVMDLHRDSIKCWVAGWARSPSEAWALKSATRRNLSVAMAEANIDFQMSRAKVDLDSPPRL